MSPGIPDSQPESAVLSVRAGACLCRRVWHRGHFCRIRHPGRRRDVKGAVKRQPPGSAGTAALGALFFFFPLWHKQTHPQTRCGWEGGGGLMAGAPGRCRTFKINASTCSVMSRRRLALRGELGHVDGEGTYSSPESTRARCTARGRNV